jgi:hypothetical protein
VVDNTDCDDAQLLYADLDGDTYGAGAPVACGVASNTDCNDGVATINPGAAEVCNGIDDNCNGLTDDGLVFVSLTMLMQMVMVSVTLAVLCFYL